MPAPTLGQYAKGPTNFATSVTTPAITTAATGSTFVVFFNSRSLASSVVDSKGNTYTLATSNTSGAFGGNNVYAYVSQNGIGGSGHTATITIAGTNSTLAYLVEVLGSSAMDQSQSNGSNTSQTAVNGATVTTTATNELVLCYYGSYSGNTVTITDSGTGFTLQSTQLVNTYPNGALSYGTFASIGTYGDTFAQSVADFFSSATLSFIGISVFPNTAPIAWLT